MNNIIDNHYLINHAMERSQQRGIKRETIEIILKFGDENYSNGTNFLSINKRKIKKLIKDKQISPSQEKDISDIIILESNGIIKTTMHKMKNFKIRELRQKRKIKKCFRHGV